MSPSNHDPSELRARMADGDEQAFGELLTHYMGDLRAYVRLHMDALLRQVESQGDLVQSCCRDLLQRRPKVEYRDEASFRNWLFGAVLNKIRDKRAFYCAHKRDVRRRVTDDLLSRAYSRIVTPSGGAMDSELREQLENAFGLLSERHRTVLTSHFLIGMSYAEIAAQNGESPDAVRGRLARAKLKLASILKPAEDDR